MTLLGSKTYLVHRSGTTFDYDTGDWVRGAVSTFDVVGSLQPVSGKDLTELDEGMRTRARWKLYVEEGQPQLRTLESAAVGAGTSDGQDLVEVGGVCFDVVNVRQYDPDLCLDHTRYFLIEPERPVELGV